MDDELLQELIDQEVDNSENQKVTKESRDEIWNKIKIIKENSHKKHIANDKSKDDWKRVAGDVFSAVKKHVGINSAGNDKKAFLRDVMTSLITPDTATYQEIKKEILQPILDKAAI